MKWTRNDLLREKDNSVDFEENITFEKEYFIDKPRLIDLKDIHVIGSGYYDVNEDIFEVDLDIEGIMITRDSITNNPVELPIDLEVSLVFSFFENEDNSVYRAKNNVVDLKPVIFELIYLEVPLKVRVEGVEYPSGDGWKIISEADYEKERKNEIDPRLLKLKTFKFEDE